MEQVLFGTSASASFGAPKRLKNRPLQSFLSASTSSPPLQADEDTEQRKEEDDYPAHPTLSCIFEVLM